MIYNYFDFIKESVGASDSEKSEQRPIYWKEQLREIFDKEWIDFSTVKYKGNLGTGIYFIKFNLYMCYFNLAFSIYQYQFTANPN